MGNYTISCCSTADLSKEWLNKRDVKYVFFHFELAGVDYEDDMGESVPPEKLFTDMLNGASTKTSQVSVQTYVDLFTESVKEGKGVLHLCLSSGISGTYNSAVVAKEQVLEDYPDAEIYIVDTLAASSGFGLLVEKAADKRDEGLSLKELYDWVEEHKLNMVHWFFSSDLTFFIRGGRVSKTAGFMGNLLGICPLLDVDYQGKLIPREKVRTKKKVIKRIVEKMEETCDDGLSYSGKCFISHSLCYDDARAVADLIEAKFTKLSGKVEIFPIGATIGSHTGPGTVALFFEGKKRNN